MIFWWLLGDQGLSDFGILKQFDAKMSELLVCNLGDATTLPGSGKVLVVRVCCEK